MLRVTTRVEKSGKVVVALEGRLDACGIPQVAQALDRAGRACTLDATSLTSIDTHARGFLAGLRDTGTHISGASMFIQALLEEQQP